MKKELFSRNKPLLIYDGDCNFCRRWILRWQSLTRERVDYAPSPEKNLASVRLAEPDGRTSEGAEAVFRTLSYAPGWRWMLWLYEKIPLFRMASEWFYGLVAGNRVFFSRLTRFFWGDRLEPATHFILRDLFLALVGLVYLTAFFSFWSQAIGLIGQNGILPAGKFLEFVAKQLGPERYWVVPTLGWIHSSDLFIHFLCGGGVVLSILVMGGFAQAPALFLLWVFYLSVVTLGQDFMEFQWDILLLETGFLSIFFAPLTFSPRASTNSPPSGTVLGLLQWLLFRLMFSSGAVKLTSGDPAWRSLTALNYHYETQPLPTWIGWYAHQWPGWFQKFSTLMMFSAELAVPFLIFFPRRVRFFGAGVLVFFQLLIALTGNYCFFNLLALLLCLLLLDDEALRVMMSRFPLTPTLSPEGRGKISNTLPPERREKISNTLPPERRGELNNIPSPRLRGEGQGERIRHWSSWIIVPLAAVVLLVSSIHLLGAFNRGIPKSSLVYPIYRLTLPFRSINSYGLFAVMTTSRPEIIVEGSDDGENWRAYEFRFKPGDLKRKPGFIAPHQPRLDWQMWFAALGEFRMNPWFANFMVRLLQGSPEVLALLKENPFPDKPPKFVRAVLYNYHFTNPIVRRTLGTWWQRELVGLYSPVLSLKPTEL